jgi:hypothetical protein
MALDEWFGKEIIPAHQWLGDTSRFVVLLAGRLYFVRIWTAQNKRGYSLSQDGMIPVYDYQDPRLHDGLELFFIDPAFRAVSNS